MLLHQRDSRPHALDAGIGIDPRELFITHAVRFEFGNRRVVNAVLLDTAAAVAEQNAVGHRGDLFAEALDFPFPEQNFGLDVMIKVFHVFLLLS